MDTAQAHCACHAYARPHSLQPYPRAGPRQLKPALGGNYEKVRHPHELPYARPHIDLELVQTQWWLGQKEEEAHVVARTKELLAQLP